MKLSSNERKDTVQTEYFLNFKDSEDEELSVSENYYNQNNGYINNLSATTNPDSDVILM